MAIKKKAKRAVKKAVRKPGGQPGKKVISRVIDLVVGAYNTNSGDERQQMLEAAVKELKKIDGRRVTDRLNDPSTK